MLRTEGMWVAAELDSHRQGESVLAPATLGGCWLKQAFANPIRGDDYPSRLR